MGRNIFFCSKKKEKKNPKCDFFFSNEKPLLDEVDEDQNHDVKNKKTKHNNQNHLRRILAIVDLIVYLMPIRPRGDPEVLVVRGKPTGPTGSLLHDRASLYSSTHFFNFTKKNKTKTKQFCLSL